MLGDKSKSRLLGELKESESYFHNELPQILEMGDFKCTKTFWFCRSKEEETVPEVPSFIPSLFVLSIMTMG